MPNVLENSAGTSQEFTSGEHPLLIFFDGECVFCNHWVEKLKQADAAANRLRFGAKQGATFAQVAQKFPQIAQIDSIVLVQRNSQNREEVQIRSQAVATILRGLSNFGFLRLMLSLTPCPLADLGYRIFSKLRYSIFGKQESCRVPSPEERNRFVD